MSRLVIDAIGHVTRKLSRSSSRSKVKSEVELNALPLLVDVPANEQEALFIKKLNECCVIFDFQNPYNSVKGKETKRMYFDELINFVRSSKGTLTENVYPEITNMFSKNVFRIFPPSAYSDLEPEIDDEPQMEAMWPHLSLAYEFFLVFVGSNKFNPLIGKKYINESFVIQLLALFDSEDPRERNYLITVLHKIYGKILALRGFIRKQISYIFLNFIYETEKFNGVSELLELISSIIKGFAVPLKEDHKVFFFKVLLPLHKSSGLAMYHVQLTHCVVEYIEKDPSLLDKALDIFLRLWPKTSSQKELLFLSELEEILEALDEDDFHRIAVPAFKQIAKSLSTIHFQVVDKALSYRFNEYLCALMAVRIDVIMPIIFPPLFILKCHGRIPCVIPHATQFLECLQDIDSNLYDELWAEHQKQENSQLRINSLASFPAKERPKEGASPEKEIYRLNYNSVITSF